MYKKVSERVSQIREKIKKEFPDFKFSITKKDNGVRIAILSAPINLLEGTENERKYTSVNNFYIDEHYKDYPEVRDALKKIDSIASEGVTYHETGDYGRQPNFYVDITIGQWDKPFEYIPKKSKRSSEKATSSAPAKRWDRGELLKECAGWKVYKKTLPDGRIVYNALKDKETAPNKGDWSAIRSEVYAETGFKWGRFGSFDKWGEITESRGEDGVLSNLCELFNKYYGSKQEEPKSEQPKRPKELAEYFSERNAIIWEDLNIKSGSQLYENDDLQKKYAERFMVAFASINQQIISDAVKLDIFAELADMNEHSLNNALSLYGFYGSDTKSEFVLDFKENPNMFLNPKNFSVSGLMNISEIVSKLSWSQGLKDMMIDDFKKSGYEDVTGLIGSGIKQTSRNIQDRIIGFSSGKHTYLQADMLATVIHSSMPKASTGFVYGKSWGVPNDYGSQIIGNISSFGFEILENKGNYFSFFKKGVDLTIDVSDNGGEFNIVNSITKDNLASVNYVVDEVALSPFTLARVIEDIYLNESENSKTEESTDKKEKLQKAIAGLQILADKGNEKAKKAIIGLQYLLNK